MGKKKKEGLKPISENIEGILHERERLEEILREKFKKEVVILFTDICGYTKYTDTHGDISGRAMLEKHNRIVLPLIDKNEGVVIKTIGDAVMASFSTPLSAVKASIAIQNGLHEYNRTAEEVNRIYVKIGINKGEALVDAKDVYGDAVNMASRIQSQAGADQILISKSVYEQVKGIDDILCRFHGNVQVKGKTEPLELYRIVWQDEDIVISSEPRVRAYEAATLKRAKKTIKVLRLEVARDDNRLKISASEHMAGEEITLKQYEEIPVLMDWIETQCHEVVDTLNTVNRKGHVRRDVLVKLRETGRVFYEVLFTASVKEKLKETKAEFLSLNLDDQLVQVPWELLNNGQEFLCQRFNMGRLVKTKQTFQGAKARVLARPLRMLIIADPKGDLKGAYLEGTQIRDHLERYKNFINVTLRSEGITPSFLKEKMKYFDIVHFAGHADYVKENPEKSGWRLSKASLTAQDILKMAGTATIPTLIFSNACQSARTEEWALAEQYQNEIFGLANAFLLAGVKHYVGTFWEILDEPSSRFALEFYKQLLSGMTTGEAMREARQSLIKEYGEESIVWASYLLYGDPTSNYMDQINLAEAEEEEEELVGVATSDASVRSLEVERSLTEEKVGKGFRIWWAVAAGMGISLLILILFMVLQQGREKHGPQNLALSPGSMLSQTIPDSDLQKTVQIIHLLSSYQDQLNERLQEKGFFKKGKPSDSWTSTPINVCMISPNWEKLDPDATGSLKPPFERIFRGMTEAFTRTRSLGMSILERERLAVLLQELNIGIPNLSTDSLKDAYTILSAQVILFPEPLSYQLNQEIKSEVSLRMVETKSTKIISAFSSAFSPQIEAIDDTASQLVRQTVRTLETEYPLQGRIMSLDGRTVEINLGSSVGIIQDQSFSVLGKTDKELPKGTIQIRSVYEQTALAKILDEEKAFKTGDRIRAIPITVSGTGQ